MHRADFGVRAAAAVCRRANPGLAPESVWKA